mmetsp:Transcript_14796/g.37724  ORF Transcript_14796/g.37724 Transcript_14796/m.37724 type:complete len:293 (+) Transcript_14796:570-1448(+)
MDMAERSQTHTEPLSVPLSSAKGAEMVKVRPSAVIAAPPYPNLSFSVLPPGSTSLIGLTMENGSSLVERCHTSADPLLFDASMSPCDVITRVRLSWDKVAPANPSRLFALPAGSTILIGVTSAKEIEVFGRCHTDADPLFCPFSSSYGDVTTSVRPSKETTGTLNPRWPPALPWGSVILVGITSTNDIDVLARCHTSTEPLDSPVASSIGSVATSMSASAERVTPLSPKKPPWLPCGSKSLIGSTLPNDVEMLARSHTNTDPLLAPCTSSRGEAAASTRPSAERATPPCPSL